MAFWKSNLSVKRGWQPAQAAKGRIYSPHSSPMLQKCIIYITSVLCLKSMTATAIHTQPTSQTRYHDHFSTPPSALMQQPGASAQKVVWAVHYRNAVQCGGFDPADPTDITGVAKLRMSHQRRTNTCLCLFVFFLSNKGPIFTLTQAYSKCTLRSQFLLGFTPNKI